MSTAHIDHIITFTNVSNIDDYVGEYRSRGFILSEATHRCLCYTRDKCGPMARFVGAKREHPAERGRFYHHHRRAHAPLDALHLAAAESDAVGYFCTCDVRLFKKAKARTDIAVRVVSPLELAQEVLV